MIMTETTGYEYLLTNNCIRVKYQTNALVLPFFLSSGFIELNFTMIIHLLNEN